MLVACTARGWLISPATSLTASPPHPSADGDTQDPLSDNVTSRTNENGPTTRTKPPHQWAQPIPANKQGELCVLLACCVKKFAADGKSFHSRTLAKEQDIIGACTTRAGRKKFVYERVPVVNLDRGGGSMLAGGIPVCRTFFKSSFGVSNHVIDACKRTFHARAYSSGMER